MVDAGLFVVAVTVMLSGLLISQSVAGMIGVTIVPSSLWVSTHSWSADATILLLLVHFALHWRWIVNAAGKLGRTRPQAPDDPSSRSDSRRGGSTRQRPQAAQYATVPVRSDHRALPALTPARSRRTHEEPHQEHRSSPRAHAVHRPRRVHARSSSATACSARRRRTPRPRLAGGRGQPAESDQRATTTTTTTGSESYTATARARRQPGYSDPYGQTDSGSSSGTTMTCPATGCTRVDLSRDAVTA